MRRRKEEEGDGLVGENGLIGFRFHGKLKTHLLENSRKNERTIGQINGTMRR